jgi:hypothetical protein
MVSSRTSPTWNAVSGATSGSSRNSPEAATRFHGYWVTARSATMTRAGAAAPRSDGPRRAGPIPFQARAALAKSTKMGKSHARR